MTLWLKSSSQHPQFPSLSIFGETILVSQQLPLRMMARRRRRVVARLCLPYTLSLLSSWWQLFTLVSHILSVVLYLIPTRSQEMLSLHLSCTSWPVMVSWKASEFAWGDSPTECYTLTLRCATPSLVLLRWQAHLITRLQPMLLWTRLTLTVKGIVLATLLSSSEPVLLLG